MTSTSQTVSREHRLYLDGRWVDGMDSGLATITSPVTGEIVAEVAAAGVTDVDRAVRAARAAYEAHRHATSFERAAWVERIADVVARRADELADAMVLEQGKPRTEAHGEVQVVAQGFRLAGEEARRLRGDTIPTEDPRKRVLTFRRPIGVIAAITPWNYPLNIPREYIAPAIASGNAIILKPAPTTAGLAALLFECIEEADIPSGLVGLLTGPSVEMATALVQHPGVNAVCFTGSSATGATVARLASGRPTLMELGGNGPTIVLSDADVERAVASIASSAFGNAGQSCTAPERIIAAPSIRAELVAGLTEAALAARLGDPREAGTTIGPLNNEAVAAKMDAHLADSVERGARITTGGKRAGGFPTALYYQPTVLDDVPQAALIHQEETFGPIAPVTVVDGDERILSLANGCALGLSAALFTRDLERAFWFAERLETGQVNINDSADWGEIHVPFGGGAGKASGSGRVGGPYTFDFMTQLRSINLDVG